MSSPSSSLHFPKAHPTDQAKARTIVLLALMAFMALSVAAWLYQQFSYAESLNHGIPIPDIITVSKTFDNLWAAGSLDGEANQFLGLSLLYGWTWAIHPSLCFLVNTALIMLCAIVYLKEFIRKQNLPAWTIVGVLGNPYLALAMIGPNKEIPLLLLTLMYFKFAGSRNQGWVFPALIVCALITIFREAYGFFLFGSTLMLQLLQYRSNAYAILVCTGCAMVAAFFGALESLIPILARNSEVLEFISADNIAVGALAGALGLDPLSPTGGLILFFLRLAYNALSLGFFPALETTEGISWLGWSYWINGLSSLILLPACLALLFGGKADRHPSAMCAAITIGTLFMISVSLFVQPRYLMPVLPFAVAAFASCSRQTQMRSLQVGLISVLMIVGSYRLLDRAPLPSEPDNFPTPSYIIEQ